MKIYLAVAYSGRQEEAFREANIHMAKLMKEGHVVISPISMGHTAVVNYGLPSDWGYWKKYSTNFIEWCDEMHIIPGWEESVGVKDEMKIAKELGKKVVHLKKIEKPKTSEGIILEHIVSIAKDISKEWRKWHKTSSDQFPSDPLIRAVHKLDGLFPGVRAGEGEDDGQCQPTFELPEQENIMRMFNNVLGIMGIVGLICFFILFCAWVISMINYNLFYERMVRKTITEMVDEKYLKKEIKVFNKLLDYNNLFPGIERNR